jgi:hypothetical protein
MVGKGIPHPCGINSQVDWFIHGREGHDTRFPGFMEEWL